MGGAKVRAIKWLPLLGCLALLAPATLHGLEPEELWRAWPTERFVTTPAPCLRPAELGALLDELAGRHPGLSVREVGRSVQGRPIRLVTLGAGERRVLLWSQMHGDEPSATPALLDLAHYLLSHRDDPDVARVLEQLTLLLVPMLNPDGAEVYTRRNALAIDVNRDALNLTTPEGRLLERLRDEHRPVLGFNLHDQNRRRTVGDSRVLSTVALLAVTGDAANTLTPGRQLARRACAAIAGTLSPHVPGGLARYDETWSPRSFGDNLTAWGTPVVLVESGGVAPDASLEHLTRLNFTALGAVLVEFARDGLAGRDPAAYDALPENNIDVWSDVVVRGGAIRQPGSTAPYRADLAFDLLFDDREVAGCLPPRVPGTPRSEITELGDARVFGAGREVDGAGSVLLAPFTVGASGWKARRWLDAAAVDRLARLGVAHLVWVVAPRHVDHATRHAAALANTGRPWIEVSSDPGAVPRRVLAERPQPPASPSLASRVARLETACRTRPAADLDAALEALWNGASRPPLRYEAPASFLLLRPVAPNGNLAQSLVESIWLDGVELPGGAP
jgi:hypothetical protein